MSAHGAARPHALGDALRLFASLTPGVDMPGWSRTALDLRYCIRPGASAPHGRDQITCRLLARASVQEGDEPALEYTVARFQNEMWRLFETVLGNYDMEELDSADAIREALSPFTVVDIAEVRRQTDVFLHMPVPGPFLGVLNMARIVDALLRLDGPTLFSICVEPTHLVGDSGALVERVMRRWREARPNHDTWSDELPELDYWVMEERIPALAQRLQSLHGAAFLWRIQIAGAVEIPRSVLSLLASEVSGQAQHMGAAMMASPAMSFAGATWVRALQRWTRGAAAGESAFAVALRNLECAENMPWDNLTEAALSDPMTALARLADLGEVARLWPLPDGSVSCG